MCVSPCFLASPMLSGKKAGEGVGGGAPGVASGCCMVTVAAEQLQETEHVMCGLRAVAHPGVSLAAPRAIEAEERNGRVFTHCP